MQHNKTEYAKSIGYTGDKDVIVKDGIVISHNNIGWIRFCHSVRRGLLV